MTSDELCEVLQTNDISLTGKQLTKVEFRCRSNGTFNMFETGSISFSMESLARQPNKAASSQHGLSKRLKGFRGASLHEREGC
jgi:hypothetical protein